MSDRFFEAKEAEPEKTDEERAPVRNVVNREALAAANQAMRDAGIDPDLHADGAVEHDQGVIPVSYTKEVHGGWQIDHGARGNDFMIQFIPRKPVPVDPRVILEAVIRVMSQYIPEDVQVYINPPNPNVEIDFYTIRLAGVLTRPGADAMLKKRVIPALGQINPWSAT